MWTDEPTAARTPVLPLVAEAFEELSAAYTVLACDAQEGTPVTPAAEWLLDNYYLVEEQVRLVEENLPQRYASELRRLTAGPFSGFPRVMEAMAVLLAHTDSRVDDEILRVFVSAYQEVSPLTIGEVWAVPIMLRAALIENLRRLSKRIIKTHLAIVEGERFADSLVVAADASPAAVSERLAELERRYAHADPAFLLRISQRLIGHEKTLEPVADWLEKAVVQRGLDLERLALTEHQRQASDQVSIANAITTIRFLDALEWREFFEETSVVEQILREDPAGVYARMEFESRDRYRHRIEELAKRGVLEEIEVAEAAISHCLQALTADAADARRGHVGYYLVDEGQRALERTVDYRPTPVERLRRSPLLARGAVYWLLLVCATLLLAAAFGWFAGHATGKPWIGALIAILALIPVSEAGITIANRAAARIWPPRILAKIDHRLPVPPRCRTLVVYTTLLTSPSAAQQIVDDMEVGFLANRDPNVNFAILADLRAGSKQRSEDDEAVIDTARAGVAALNERYSRDGRQPFSLYVRGRVWNDTDELWMGWERKRGALVELCRLLRGAADTSFIVVDSDTAEHAKTAFVITLDTDTVLPRDGARKLISAIAHPLNRAAIDPLTRTVRQGYGLIQPRVAMSLEGSDDSVFAWLYSGVTGIDPYAGAVSDTYQDVFGEGSYTGKGIFEIDVFNAVLDGRFPDNTLLSHDLLEGSYLRTGLASDIEVYDEQPSSYISHCARLHRWVRGDWQTLPWLFPRVPTAHGRERNPLTMLHRWKIADNLRRSLVAPSTVLLVIVGFAVFPAPCWTWLAVIAALLLFPLAHGVMASLAGGSPTTKREPEAVITDIRRETLRSLLDIAVLPHQAQLMLDAIARALWRMTVLRRNLLEWETAAEVERRLGSSSLRAFVARMWPSLAFAAAAAGPIALSAGPAALAPYAPLLAAWLASPAAAWKASLPLPPPSLEISEHDLVTMRRIARKTWRFFETFVTPEDHYLAPDNFQEEPKGQVAHRTSPTNMGLQLLSTVTAYDLGYLTVAGFAEHVSRTIATMVGLDRFRGHFYNWYDTQTLEPLRPTYVSTVDSGNLAGHLIALRVALEQAAERPLLEGQILDGIADTARLALEDLDAAQDVLRTQDGVSEARGLLEETVRRTAFDMPPRDPGAWVVMVEGLLALTAPLDAFIEAAAESAGADARARQVVDSLLAVRRSVDEAHAMLVAYAPWAFELNVAGQDVTHAHPALAPLMRSVPSLADLAEGLEDALSELDSMSRSGGEDAGWAARVAEGVRAARLPAERLLGEMRLTADIARQMWEHMDFGMLFDERRMLFSVGFNTAEGRLDDSYYDMLASECRLASFVAIAKGDVPQEHWFRLSRAVTQTESGTALVSWSASMFEYLMPLLVMKSWPNTLLDKTYRTVVRRQIQYGRERGVPWGVSESAFNAKDVELTYQYQAFGVPGLGLKRGLSADIVIAPYATILAAMVAPRDALDNLAVLSREGAEGRLGYYEAIDYTPGRVPAGQRKAIVKAYMAHHQGMSMVALGNVLCGFRMQERFHSDPLVASAELLLQERAPRRIQIAKPRAEEVDFVRSARETPTPIARAYPLANTPVPATHFLSNGPYSVMITNAGGGYSRWRDRTVTRYREDITRDCWGTFFYIRDVETGVVWSAAFQPALAQPDEYHVTFSADKADFRRRDGDIETHMEVFVSPEDDVEIRRLTILNHGRKPVSLDVTSYFEATLAPRGADRAHKAYSNLFVETEALEDCTALLFSRRPRSSEEPRYWGLHVLACESSSACQWSYETDRAAFLGRLRAPASPQALEPGAALSRSVGAVLDPICAIRQPLAIDPGATARLAFVTGAADSRERIEALAEKYHDIANAQRAADLAWSTSLIELRDLGITPEEAVTYLRLASRMLLTDPYSRLKVHTEVENRLPISGLWQIGVSGDYPILLVKVREADQTHLVRHALLAHQYWRSKGFETDLVILNMKPTGYTSELDDRLRALMRTGHALQLTDRPGGVFLRTADQIQPDVLNLLESVARVVIDGDQGPIALQLDRRAVRPEPPPDLVPSESPAAHPTRTLSRPSLAFANGFGGFDLDRHEYVIVLDDRKATPAPWANVMAGPRFGALVSEAGIGCTWAENSHENRITTWNNDPVSDGTGECVYIRDEDTGEFWSPTLLPTLEEGTYVVRHGRGYSRFEHASHGIGHQMDWLVARSGPVRIVRLRLENQSGVTRRLSVTQFIEWVLGDSRSAAQQRVVTWWDDASKSLMAHNHFNMDFPGLPAFLAADDGPLSYTASRTEFIGRNGHPSAPAAMRRTCLGGVTGRFHDNCGAIMRTVELGPDASAEVIFLLGQTPTIEEAHALIERFRAPGAVDEELRLVQDAWSEILGTVEVSTPDPALDIMVTAALYQSLSCRMWGRTAIYQSSGAFGFRDQLQDCLALMDSRPDIVRGHIIECSRRQFMEGDVLHWWQPVSGRGVRTRISDDRHWLPLIAAEYVRATGDLSVLDVETPFLEGPPVPDDREDLYLQPVPSVRVATVYDHCLAALSLCPAGPHGLPLIGGGDWNDGMNRVGAQGRGESVWLAWFLDVTMRSFAEICDMREDAETATALRQKAASFVAAAEESGWDGAWYRRAFFDDGTPLGTAQAEECRIDAIAQAWSVLSGQGDPARARRAMESVEGELVCWDEGLIALLAPPFDKMERDPGYIKGYVPGVRENGGQYTHAALWVALAYARLGDGDEAVSLMRLLNPISHALDTAAAEKYKVEPYVLSADVYAVEPHTGRGGWTWYTGSAAWFYHVAVREILGIRTETSDGDRYLLVDPCIPKTWNSFSAAYRYGKAVYAITVQNPRGVNRGVARVTVDGRDIQDARVRLIDDGAKHHVTVAMLGG